MLKQLHPKIIVSMKEDCTRFNNAKGASDDKKMIYTDYMAMFKNVVCPICTVYYGLRTRQNL